MSDYQAAREPSNPLARLRNTTWWQRCRDMTTFQVAPPERFNFSLPDEWPKWIRRFDRFRCASGLSEREEENQVHTLIYSMGEEADDILSSFELSVADQKKYETVKGKFESYFVKRRNTIFERAKFNRRKQEEGETIDEFILNLHRLAEHCAYGVLREEVIRDRIVVGLRNSGLSEKLQMDATLTLEKATAKRASRKRSRSSKAFCAATSKRAAVSQ